MTVQNVGFFDTWQQGYASATVTAYVGGTMVLASLFKDIALTIPADNPQTLINKTDANGVSYGKFREPLYTAQAFRLETDQTDITGIVEPRIVSLTGENASAAVATASGGTQSRTVAAHLANEVWAANFGTLTPSNAGSASTNNTTITAAIAAAAALGGGRVRLPPGNYYFTQLTLGGKVRLAGAGLGVTTLSSTVGANVVTLAAAFAGLEDLTVDGVNVVASSVGIYAKNIDDIGLIRVEAKRFETNLRVVGCARPYFEQLFLRDGTNNAKLEGNLDTVGGAEFKGMVWHGGEVSGSTSLGLYLAFIDQPCWHHRIVGVSFRNNAGDALKIRGGQFIQVIDPAFSGNSTDWRIEDDTDTSKSNNRSADITIVNPMVAGGSVRYTGWCRNILVDRPRMTSVTSILTNPENLIIYRDAIEDAACTVSGTTRSLVRQTTGELGRATGRTTDNVFTAAYAITPEPGEVVFVEASIVANAVNGVDNAVYLIAQGARRAPSTIGFQGQTTNFTLGQIVTGGTSGAKGLIVAQSDSGATGTLSLRSISGTFVMSENLSDPLGGNGQVNATLTPGNSALLGSLEVLHATETDTDFDVKVEVSGAEVQIQVKGDTGKTVDWGVTVRVRRVA